MKKIKVFFFSLLSIKLLFSQVGIGTTSPQEQLHVAGQNATIRIDGLNSTNNANNPGTKNQPVYVNADGNLILQPKSGNEMLLDTSVPATADVEIETTSTSGSRLGVIYDYTFTLTQDAFVTIAYEVSFSLYTLSGNIISDGQAKKFTSYIKHTFNGNSTNYASQSKIYSSNTGSMSGYFKNSSSVILKLAAGEHTINLSGWVMGSAGNYTSNPFKAIIPVNQGGYLKIVAQY